MKFVIRDIKDGYLYFDDLAIGGVSYDPEIDKFTVLFDKREDAEYHCGYGEVVEEFDDEKYNQIMLE